MIDIIKLADTSIAAILEGRSEDAPDVTGAVMQILQQVRKRRDGAVREYTLQFDGVSIDSAVVTKEEIAEGRALVPAELVCVMEQAAANIRAFHQKQVRQGFVMAEREGVVMGQKITPLDRVGVYVPGGTAAYPSTVIMDVVPAQVAGVREVVMVTPPAKDGKVTPAILAAADILGVSRIYKMGGAQAVGALAYGTETVPKVDKIVGPGNIYVATAKKLVYGDVDIDMIAGPSDILVLADDGADPVLVAADMLGQAEHDVNAAAVLITTSMKLAEAVKVELGKQLQNLPRRAIAETSINANGRIILANNMEAAIDMANALAPEHLEICTDEPFSLLPKVKNAGSIFLGHNTPEALGDYLAGPNHTLPTSGTARFYSPLSVDDYIKKSSYLYYSHEALQQDGKQVQLFARSEGLEAHAKSVELRMNKGNNKAR